MSLTLNQTGKVAVEKVASQYREKGYTVNIEPSPADLPTFLKGFQLDLIAQNDTERVVVEVKPRAILVGSARLEKLAQVIQANPGWRFELVVVNPQDEGLYSANNHLKIDEIEKRLNEGQELLRLKYNDASFLIVWSALEAALWHIGQHANIGLYENSPAYLIKNLAFLGLVDSDDYEVLWDLLKVRNSLVHGYTTSVDDYKAVEDLVAITQRLITNQQS